MLRLELLARRRDTADLAELDAQLDALITAFVAGADSGAGVHSPEAPLTVAAYVPQGPEPGTETLPQLLADLGARVLLPVVGKPGPLNWAEFQDDLVPARFGLLEPSGPLLGEDAIAQADVIVVPGLAGSPSGARMGRGGGFYDRSLPLANPQAPRLLALYPWEIVDDLPSEPHDIPVTHIATPTGIRVVNKQ